MAQTMEYGTAEKMKAKADFVDESIEERHRQCDQLHMQVLENRDLIIAANRGPVTFESAEAGNEKYNRGGGGLVTALLGLAAHVQATWIASAASDADRQWREGLVQINDGSSALQVKFVTPDPESYDGYYNVIANPLLWFLQHNMWDLSNAPTINKETWLAWETGYVAVNQLFADAIVQQIRQNEQRSLVMLQDYQLYLAPGMIRNALRNSRKKFILTHFVHIPWPGPEDWGFLPPTMRRAILESLCAVDMLGFQTREDGLNFIRTCESHLPRAHVNFKHGRVWFRNHATHIRDFPISIDVDALRRVAFSDEAASYTDQFMEQFQDCNLVVRIDRTDPSKNIVRGFQAFEELLELYPEHRGKVTFLAIMAPSRLLVEEYQNYLDSIMAAAGRVNARFSSSDWEPIRVLVGENYARAIGAMRLYDVLLVNSIADGMNLVAKEGPIVNGREGVLILSERTGARQQLEVGALIISPCDVYATAQAIHQALTMPEAERAEFATRLRYVIEREDIQDWLCRQLEMLVELRL